MCALIVGALLSMIISEGLADRIFDASKEQAMEKQCFEWKQVTLSPAVWQYTDGNAVKATISQSGPVWRWSVGLYDDCAGVERTLEAAQQAAEGALNEWG